MQKDNLFQERLTELMTENGVNTVTLSSALGVSAETIRRWKNGERLILLPHLINLADYFKCSIDFLVGRTETVLDFNIQKTPPFYERLRFIMEEKGISRYKLVKDLSIYDSYFTNWKQGKNPNILTLIMLADYFNITVDYLIGRDQ